MYENLQIIIWPDPRLKKVSKPVEVFDGNLKELAARMFELMRENKGVGLAAHRRWGRTSACSWRITTESPEMTGFTSIRN